MPDVRDLRRILATSAGTAIFALSAIASADIDAGASSCSDAGVSSAGAWFWDSTFPFGTTPPTGSGPGAVWAFAPDDAWVAGSGALLVHWDGTSWTPFAGGTLNSVHQIWGSSSTDVWAVAGGLGGTGNYSTMIHWDGAAWSNVNPGTTDPLLGVWGDAPNDVWALGAHELLHFDGAKWTSAVPVGGGFSSGLSGLWGTGPHDVWAVQQGDPMFHFTGVWTAMPSGAPTAQDAVFETVWAPRPGEAWAAGWAVFHYEGLAWALVTTPLGPFWRRAWGRATDDLWIAGDHGIIHWDGTSWAVQSTEGFLSVGGYARQAGRQRGPFACTDREGVWAVASHAVFRFVPEAVASPTTCAQIGGTCAASCAANQSMSDYSCGPSGGVCCVRGDACTATSMCCNPDGTVSSATQPCDDGLFVCPAGTSFSNCRF
jgi:hypothetical protein